MNNALCKVFPEMRQRQEFARHDPIGINRIPREFDGPAAVWPREMCFQVDLHTHQVGTRVIPHRKGNQAHPLLITTPGIASNLETPFHRRIASWKSTTNVGGLESGSLLAEFTSTFPRASIFLTNATRTPLAKNTFASREAD